MTTQGSNSKTLRTNNKRVILWKLFNNGPMSRIELAKECGLTGAAITIIVRELLDSGKLLENGERMQRNPQGRKEVLLDINYSGFLACNINIERDRIHFSLCSLKGIILESISHTVEMLGIEFLRINIERITRGYEDRLLGIGVGVTGAVDEETGELLDASGLFPNGLNLREELGRYFEVPIYVCNNVKAHAKAIINDENKNFVYIKHGPGLGCAIVVDGVVLNGHTSRAGELSKVRLSSSFAALEPLVMEVNLLAKTQYHSIKELYDAYLSDSCAKVVLDDGIKTLVYCVINMCRLIDPENIIIAGGMFYNEPTYVEFRKQLSARDSEVSAKTVLMSEETNIKGVASARLVFNKLFFEF
ncbi:MAG: ROK family transcriptional regulator [Clostridia bacterium]|nr:ROK family transcriptional regulator [Clostridia bacterium]